MVHRQAGSQNYDPVNPSFLRRQEFKETGRTLYVGIPACAGMTMKRVREKVYCEHCISFASLAVKKED